MECAKLTIDERGPVLLVVDDYPENLVTMCAVLQGQDWQVLTASSGDEALNMLLQYEVDLVLLDVQMPGMDGFEVARLMRGSLRTRLTPIIFLTANMQSQDAVLKGYAAGAVDFLFKPFDPKVLKPKVQALLEVERNRRALQRLSRELESARAFNASILDNSAEGILVVEESGQISFANPAIARLLGFDTREMSGMRLLDHLREPQGCEWTDSELYRHYCRGEIYRLHDVAMLDCNGHSLPVALSCAPLPSAQHAMVVTVLDMSVVQALHQQLESQAVTDSLTGLLNRRGFNQAVESALARSDRSAKPMAILYLDLDGFKRINDSLGHDAGDRILRRVAELLKECMRPYDVLARMGGDEFTALLDGLEHPEDAARVAEKLIDQVSIRQQIDGIEVTLGASIGIATYPECGSSLDGLLRAADIAMYEAKRSGRQQYRFYDQEMNGRARSRLMLEESVRNAIENQDFSLAYQPQVYLADGRLRGFEALLRWQHPSAGNVPPGVFIPLLEETRLINRIGEWIFQQSAEQRRVWSTTFQEDLVLSVNVSAVQFSMPNLVDELQRVIEFNNLKPNQLEVEVTESSLIENLEHTHLQLQQLRRLGVRVALDDFGTGYSSLAYLRHFEIDTLKIDRLFIANLLASPKDAAVVRTIIDLCEQLGLEVIAEGVETEAQRQWLLANGCQIMQGFLVSRPLPIEQANTFPQVVDWSTLHDVL